MVAPPAERTDSGTAPVASVIVPACNEGRVIGRCLRSLTDQDAPRLEIVVAANGCTDDTVAIARGFSGVHVLDLPEASKSEALNRGDEAATTMPRLYLDADITLDPDVLRALVDSLSTGDAVVASPNVRFDTAGCSWPVRRFYDTYAHLPYVTDRLIGLGAYGVSASGRDRFDTFPDLQADDLFIQRIFRPEERITSHGHFTVRAPRDLGNLLRVRTRVAAGSAELSGHGAPTDRPRAFESTSTSTAAALLRLAKGNPERWPGVAVYAAVVILARVRALSGSRHWHRDESTH